MVPSKEDATLGLDPDITPQALVMETHVTWHSCAASPPNSLQGISKDIDSCGRGEKGASDRPAPHLTSNTPSSVEEEAGKETKHGIPLWGFSQLTSAFHRLMEGTKHGQSSKFCPSHFLVYIPIFFCRPGESPQYAEYTSYFLHRCLASW